MLFNVFKIKNLTQIQTFDGFPELKVWLSYQEDFSFKKIAWNFQKMNIECVFSVSQKLFECFQKFNLTIFLIFLP